jgi:hypothetical protein
MIKFLVIYGRKLIVIFVHCKFLLHVTFCCSAASLFNCVTVPLPLNLRLIEAYFLFSEILFLVI